MKLNLKDFKYLVYFQGEISEEKVNLIYTPKEKKFSQTALKIIEEKWNEKKDFSYDGDLIDFINAKNNQDKIDLYFDYTKFSYTVASRSKEYLNSIEEGDYISNHISIPTIIKTKDKKFMIGSDGTIKNGKQYWKFVGGYWEKSAARIWDNVKKECQEEVGISEYISNCKVLCIADCGYATCIVTIVDCSLNSNEILSYIEKNRENIVDIYEMSNNKFINLEVLEVEKIINDDSYYLGRMTFLTLNELKRYLSNKE